MVGGGGEIRERERETAMGDILALPYMMKSVIFLSINIHMNLHISQIPTYCCMIKSTIGYTGINHESNYHLKTTC